MTYTKEVLMTHCWANDLPWHHCNKPVEPDGIGLCKACYDRLRDPEAPMMKAYV